MSAILRPLLAQSADTEQDLTNLLKRFGYMYLSEKIDGIRAIKGSDGILYARSGKPIANRHIQKAAKYIPTGFDMEISFWIDNKRLRRPTLESIESVVNSKEDKWPGRWRPMFYVFDRQIPGTFEYRIVSLDDYNTVDNIAIGLIIHSHFKVDKLQSILNIFKSIIDAGGEGIILRAPLGGYKQGRSTLSEGLMIRYKKVTIDTADVIGFESSKTHTGVIEVNPFGLAKRDKKKENLRALDQVGSLTCTHPKYGEFNVGGLTDAQKLSFFRNLPKRIAFKHRDVTHKGKPRNPSFDRVID